FMGTDRASRFQYTYLPFGAGPRNCVGMRFVLTELKVALAYLVANFKINRCPQTKVPLEFRKVPVLLIPKNVFVSLEPRNDNPLLK
ncbi:cytochrome P450 3A11, partial [Caerostris extrusa]